MRIFCSVIIIIADEDQNRKVQLLHQQPVGRTIYGRKRSINVHNETLFIVHVGDDMHSETPFITHIKQILTASSPFVFTFSVKLLHNRGKHGKSRII